MQHAYYEQLHELARPAHVAKLGPPRRDADGVVVTAREVGARAGGASIVDAIETTRRWRQLQLANRDFYGGGPRATPVPPLLVGEVFQCCAGDKSDADGRALHGTSATRGTSRHAVRRVATRRRAARSRSPTSAATARTSTQPRRRSTCRRASVRPPVVARFTRDGIDATIGGFKVAER